MHLLGMLCELWYAGISCLHVHVARQTLRIQRLGYAACASAVCHHRSSECCVLTRPTKSVRLVYYYY